MWTKCYAGIGSRQTPAVTLSLMERIAKKLAKRGLTLRSGGANGADTAFERGAAVKEIYLPWPGFNGNKSVLNQPSEAAMRMAATLHPAWNRLEDPAKKMMARNCHQVLGANLDVPADFVICWTADAAQTDSDRSSATGGTGQAISLADRYAIPVFNLARTSAIDELSLLLSKQEKNEPKAVEGINIFSGETGLGAWLTNPTGLAVGKGGIPRNLPVTYEGELFPDSEAAYHAKKGEDPNVNDLLMANILSCKFEQHAWLAAEVESRGGVKFLYTCSHYTYARSAKSQSWEGFGEQSRFIRNLITGYRMYTTKSRIGLQQVLF